MRFLRVVAWATMTLLALGIALYALWVLIDPSKGAPLVAERLVTIPWAVYAHLGGSLWALAVGPFQLHRRIRESALGRHRWLGRSYVVGALVGAIGGLALAPRAETGAVAALGFGALGVLWLSFTLTAFLRIRAGDQAAHRRWMMRSYALTLAAVTLRIYLPLSFMAGLDFSVSYPVIAWLAWVPNLVVAELYVRQSPSPAPVPIA